jgi:hypothetical protein
MDVNEALKCIRKEEAWPPPPIVSEYEIDGDLLRRLRKVTNSPFSYFLLRETESTGGYSEYTSETWYDFEIVSGETIIFSALNDDSYNYRQNGLVKLLEWLDKKEAEGDNSISS